jgi:hypothetical protein
MHYNISTIEENGPGKQKYQGGFSLAPLPSAKQAQLASKQTAMIAMMRGPSSSASSAASHTRVSSNPKLIHPRITTLPQRLYTSMELSSRSWHVSLFD